MSLHPRTIGARRLLGVVGALTAFALLSALQFGSSQRTGSHQPSQPVPHGISDYVAYWPFDEGAGQVVHDVSHNRLHGLVDGATWSTGVRGGALEFDGLDDMVEIPGLPDTLGDLGQGTISVWFRFDSTPPQSEIHPLFYLGDGLGGQGPSALIIEIGHFATGTKLYFTILDGAHVPQCYDSGFDLVIGRWYHFAAVVGPGFNTGYLDGVEMVDRHYNFGAPTDDYFIDDVASQRVTWFGRGFLSSIPTHQLLHGALDEIRIYDRPLTAPEVAAYYQSAAPNLPASSRSWPLRMAPWSRASRP